MEGVLYCTYICSAEKAQETATSESFFCSVLELFWREGGEVQGGGGRWSKVGVPHKGHWQRSVSYCELSMPLSVCIRWESACTCVFQHSLVSLIPTGWLTQNNKNSEQRNCFWRVSASILRRNKSEEQTCLAAMKD